MISHTIIKKIDLIKCRNKVNNVLKKHNITNILITTVAMFKNKNSVIFIMIENNTADQLIEHRAI